MRKTKPVDAEELQWSLRVSRRARYARLRIMPFGGLEVVIPYRFPRHQVAALVAQHADWARAQLARQARLRDSIQLPEALALAFDNSLTPIHYAGAEQPSQGDLFGARSAQAIDIYAREQRAIIAELRQWIRQRARRLLPPLLARVARQTGLSYQRVSIRSQKTRWGSCSSSGNISLNDQLLFLPPDAVEYLMIHELCHTRHLDHSAAFWALVQSHCADYRRHEKRLGASRSQVPDWFLLDLYS
jgi:predicted metal-dependent hydrolase